MATIKSYTDIEQSKKLAKILPLESADYTRLGKDEDNVLTRSYFESCSSGLGEWIGKDEMSPCWSLASLLEQLDDNITDDDGNDWQLEINKEDGQYYLSYHDRWGNKDDIETDYYDDLVDACCDMILKLHELNLL